MRRRHEKAPILEGISAFLLLQVQSLLPVQPSADLDLALPRATQRAAGVGDGAKSGLVIQVGTADYVLAAGSIHQSAAHLGGVDAVNDVESVGDQFEAGSFLVPELL